MASYLYQVADSVNSHIPYGAYIAPQATAKYNRDSVLDHPIDLSGRVTLLFAAATTLLETIGSLAATVLTSLAVGLTSGSFNCLNETAEAFRNNTLKGLYYTGLFTAGAVIHPKVAQLATQTKITSAPAVVQNANHEFHVQENLQRMKEANPILGFYGALAMKKNPVGPAVKARPSLRCLDIQE